jgi:putative addiction module killer protein
MLTILEFLDDSGASPFGAWFGGLDAVAAAKVTTAVRRLELGNFSNVKGVGGGVFEYRIHFGPGHRIYFGKDGENAGDPARWRRQETAGPRHRNHARAMGRLQEAEVPGEMTCL